jgi:acetyl esterase/lipase
MTSRRLAAAARLGALLLGLSAAAAAIAHARAELRALRGRLPTGLTLLTDIRYGSEDPAHQVLDLYLPPGRRRAPVVLWIHGGGWRTGTRKEVAPVVSLVSSGYALASIDYRLTPEARFPAPLDDCRAAVRWLHAHAGDYRLDSARVAAVGSSAGGHLAALLGVIPDQGGPGPSSRVQAVVDFFGAVDLADSHLPRLDVDRLIGGTPAALPAAFREASPVARAGHDACPFLIVHGDRDQIVPMEQSVRFQAALQQAGVPVALRVVPGGGHDSLTILRALPSVRRFLASHLGPV